MLNETPTEETKVKWYNTNTVRISFGVTCLVVGTALVVIGMKKRNSAIAEASDSAKEALRTLANVGMESIETAGETFDDAVERLSE